jgi:hypothetical protein
MVHVVTTVSHLWKRPENVVCIFSSHFKVYLYVFKIATELYRMFIFHSHSKRTFDFKVAISLWSVLIISLPFKNSSERFCKDVCLLTRMASFSARFSSRRDYNREKRQLTFKKSRNFCSSFTSVLHNFPVLGGYSLCK